MRLILSALSATLLLNTLSPVALQAQQAESSPNSRMSGEIILEETGQVRDTYRDTQDAVIVKVDSLVTALSQGGGTNAAQLTSDEITYLNAVYLHCSISRGTCPMILDGLLAMDVIAAAQSSTAECSNLSAFWRQWMGNQMEERHKYMVRTGAIHATAEFNRSVRPRYIKCPQTIAEMGVIGKGAQAVTKVLSPESNLRTGLTNTSQYLKAVREQIPNIFRAVQPVEAAPERRTRGSKK